MSQLTGLIVDELLRASQDIQQEELDRARAQIRAGLLMSMESPTSRAGQLARQVLLFGRTIPNEELMERLDALSVERIRDLAGRIFQNSKPTLTALGPLEALPKLDMISDMLKGRTSIAAE